MALQGLRTEETVKQEKEPQSSVIAKKKVEKKPSYQKHRTDTSAGTCATVRNVPRSVIDAMHSEFQGAEIRSQTDLLLAYLACHSTGFVHETIRNVLTESQQKIVDCWTGDSMSQLSDKVERLVGHAKAERQTMDVIHTMLTLLLADRLGFTSNVPPTPNDLNFRDDVLIDVAVQAERQSAGFQDDVDHITKRKPR